MMILVTILFFSNCIILLVFYTQQQNGIKATMVLLDPFYLIKFDKQGKLAMGCSISRGYYVPKLKGRRVKNISTTNQEYLLICLNMLQTSR